MDKPIERKHCKNCDRYFKPIAEDLMFHRDKSHYSVFCPFCGEEVYNSKFARY